MNKRKPRTLLQLGAHHCRWPLWDDHLTPLQEKLFCSEHAPGVEQGQPYCPAHAKKARSLVYVRR